MNSIAIFNKSRGDFKTSPTTGWRLPVLISDVVPIHKYKYMLKSKAEWNVLNSIFIVFLCVDCIGVCKIVCGFYIFWVLTWLRHEITRSCYFDTILKKKLKENNRQVQHCTKHHQLLLLLLLSKVDVAFLGFLQPTTIFVPAKASGISKLFTQYKSILTLLLNTMMCTFNPFIYHLYYYYLALLHYMYNGYNITKYSFVVSSFGSVKL